MPNSTNNGVDYVQFTPEQLQLSNGTPLGAGAISQVVQSKLRGTCHPGLPIVVKILSKIQLLQQRKVEAAMNEKAALLRLAPHPFIARLYGTAQSEDELYFVMECLPHGDLLQHIRRTASKRIQDYSATTAAALTVSVEDKQEASTSAQCAAGSDSAANATVEGKREVSKEADKSSSPREAMSVCTAATPVRKPKLVPIPVSSDLLRCLDLNDIRLIAAQLVLALARAYVCGIVLRDLKPENVVFDEKYRACLIDFDTADLAGMACLPESNDGIALKERREETSPLSSTPTALPSPPAKRLSVSDIQNMRKKTASFCGTAQYVSPEMVCECKWSFSSDLWALGATVYEMLYGTHLFSGLSAFEVLRKVVKGVSASELTIPFPFVNLGGPNETHEDGGFAAVKDFILGLVNTNPAERLGVNATTRGFDLDSIKAHPLFKGFDWAVLEQQLETFHPRVFSRKCDQQQERRRQHQQQQEVLAAGEDDERHKNEGGEAAEDVRDPDAQSPSLASLYHRVPFNDPHYADYVYKATADANPFERFMKHIMLDSVDAEKDESLSQATQQEQEESGGIGGGAEGHGAAAASAASSSAPTAMRSSPSSDEPLRFTRAISDEIMDVIDDVGINCEGMVAHEDFRQ